MSEFEQLPKAPVRITNKPIEDRVSLELSLLIDELFEQRFPNLQHDRDTHSYYWITSGQRHDIPSHFEHAYSHFLYPLILIMENLREHNIIPLNPIFDNQNKMRPDTTKEESRSLFRSDKSEGILNKLRIAVIGGPEAEIFHALGAEAVGIDPNLNRLPKTQKLGLTEISRPLDDSLMSDYHEIFDITCSSRFLDFAVIRTEGSEKLQTLNHFLNLMIAMTKRGGLSIHSGDALPYILPQIDPKSAKTLSIVPEFRDDRWGRPGMWVTLQKKALEV